MKKILALSLLALTTMFTSCSSDSDGGSSSLGSMSAKIDGQSWSTNLTAASITDIDIDGGGKALQILGTKADQTAFTIVIPITNLSVGSHTYSGFDAAGSLSYISPAFELYDSAEDQGSFTVNITDVDLEAGKISGTFSGTLVDFDETTTISITEGKFTDVTMISSSFYTDGTMTLTKNGGTPFEMDENDEDGKYLLLSQTSVDNSLMMIGYNATLTSDFGIYSVSVPLNVTPGTYSLIDDEGFKADLANDDNSPEYQITSGTVTVTSHNNKNLVGTFSFTANNGNSTVNITNGAFDVTHK